MQKVLILHGWGGSDDPHWQAWLAGEIAKEYGTVSFPLLDNPHFPSKNRWMRQVKTLLETFQPDTVVCHSLANILWFHLCHEAKISPVKKLLLVAPPRLTCEIETLKTFFPLTAPASLFSEEVLMLVSNNDPYLTLEEAQQLSIDLNIDMEIVHNGGHLNADSGYGEWPFVKEWVLQ